MMAKMKSPQHSIDHINELKAMYVTYITD